MFDRERTIKTDFQDADFLAFGCEMLDRLFCRFRAGTHQNDDTICIRSAYILKERILPAGQFCKLVHNVLHNARNRVIKFICRFACLKKDIGILRRSAHDRMIRIQRALTKLCD